MNAIRRDIVDRLREVRRVVQFDSAGQMIAFDGEPSDLEREAADEIERLRLFQHYANNDLEASVEAAIEHKNLHGKYPFED